MKYDGSININTKIDGSGFKKGIKDMDDSAKTSFLALLQNILTSENKLKAVGMAAKAAFGKMSKGAMVAIVSLGLVVGIIGLMITLLAAVIVALIGLTVAAVAFSVKMVNSMAQAVAATNKYGRELRELQSLFKDVQGALYTAFSPLVSFALPYIRELVNWVVEFLNLLAMAIAYLTGASTAMQYVAGSAAAAAGGAGALAENAERAGEAAKGALAAFDELNVLQQADDQTAPTTGGTVTGKFRMVEVEIDEGIMEKLIDRIKEGFGNLWEFIKESGSIAWRALLIIWRHSMDTLIERLGHAWGGLKLFISVLWEKFADWFNQKVWTPVSEFAKETWETIKKGAIELWDDVVELWGNLGEWWNEYVAKPVREGTQRAWEAIQEKTEEARDFLNEKWEDLKYWWTEYVADPIREKLAEAWENIKAKTREAWDFLVEKWQQLKEWWTTNVSDPITTKISEAWKAVEDGASAAWKWITTEFSKAKTWWTDNVAQPMEDAFSSALEAIAGFFKTKFDEVTETIRTALNNIIGKINSMLSSAESGINGLIGALNNVVIRMPPILGGGTIGFNIPPIKVPNLPLLADGAVIPPNSAFAAILGDQRTGTNIETPESLLREIVQEEVGRQVVAIEFKGTMAALIKALDPEITKERKRVGTSLLEGVA